MADIKIDTIAAKAVEMEDSKYVDITDILIQWSREELSPDKNPMLHVPHFSLMDSMAAIQIMSPSMDCCAGAPLNELRNPMSIHDLPFGVE